MEIKKLLEEEIVSEFKDLNKLQPGSAEKEGAIDDLVKLCRLRIDADKVEIEMNESEYKKKEDEFRKNQLTEQTRDRYFRLGIEAAGIILPLIFYAAWMKRGFRFEETGTYTSSTFKNLFNRFKPVGK